MTSITLKKPITVGDKQIVSIDVEEPSVGAVEAFEVSKAAGEPDMTATIKMLAFEFGWPEAAIRSMRSSDLVMISNALAPFVAAAGLTGDPSSQT